ncbi:MAG TPA: TonB-dependent receptor plug domain-containing protein, partial [Cellvibrio sp.]
MVSPLVTAEQPVTTEKTPATEIAEQLILPTPTLAQNGEITNPPAQTRLGKVTVTSRKKIPPLQTVKEVPASISIVAGEELTKQQTSNYRDILKRIGNVKWGGSSTNPTTTALAVRGVGYLGSGGALGFDGSVNT